MMTGRDTVANQIGVRIPSKRFQVGGVPAFSL